MIICYKSVADFGEIITGKTPSTGIADYWDGDIPFITPTDIVGYDMHYIFDTERQVSQIGANSQRKTILPRNAICVSCIASIGKMCITSADKSITNQQINSIIVGEKYDYRYLFYLLRHFLPYIQLIGGGTGSGTPIISKAKFSKLKYPICENITIQRKVADILSAYDSLIEVNNKRIKVLEQMAENLYKEWFVRFRFPGHETAEFENGIPKGWKEDRLVNFGITLDSGSRPSGGIDDSLSEGMPSLGAESVNGLGEFNYNDVKIIPEDYYNKMKRGKNTGKDILVYKDGAYIGRVTIFMNGFPFEHFSVNEHVFLLNATNEKYQYFLYFTLHLPEYFVLMQNLNRNAAQPGLSKPDMNRIKVTVPSAVVVEEFNHIVGPMLNNVFELAKQNNNLIKQRDLLLPRLMSGKLEV